MKKDTYKTPLFRTLSCRPYRALAQSIGNAQGEGYTSADGSWDGTNSGEGYTEKQGGPWD